MSKRIILCADDFGQAPHISQAILNLANNKRISATSCMTTASDWIHSGEELKGLQDKIDIGLHFNLTHGDGDNFRPISYWLLHSIAHQIDKKFIESRLNEQLDSFVNVLGRSPDFIDGHLHVHTLPVIRDLVIKVIKERFHNSLPYVRSLNPMLHTADSSIMKSFAIRAVSYGFTRALDLQKIKHNTNFGGIYSLQQDKPYRQFMIRWLQQATPDTLIMCHPGLGPDVTNKDPSHTARPQEYLYLSSEEFLQDCSHAGISIGRFSCI
jgi:predicted glycoside hydrolase/deacetylase ChbG (UPF0249 family)